MVVQIRLMLPVRAYPRRFSVTYAQLAPDIVSSIWHDSYGALLCACWFKPHDQAYALQNIRS